MEILDYLHHAGSSEPAQGLRIAVLAAALRNVEGVTYMILNRLGKCPQVL
jgi:hypothetical protein